MAGKDYMRVSWVTEKDSRSIVEYGKTAGKYDASATGENDKYHYFFYSSGQIHHVKIGPLDPSTTYYYRCGGGGPEFSFRTPPSAFPVEFAVAGRPHFASFIISLLRSVFEVEIKLASKA